MQYILGLNAFHGDSSACLVANGQLVAAAEEERFRRIKHWAGFPIESVGYCLREAGISIGQVDHVAINHNPSANFWKKALYTVVNRPDVGFIADRLRNKAKRASAVQLLSAAFAGQEVRAQVHHIDHHFAHLASAFFVSPFDDAVAVSVDGFGDFSSAAWGIGLGNSLRLDGQVHFPHSLGIFYEALTQYLGFPHYGDEYKVMGLAPYGEPRFLDKMRQIVKLHADGTYSLNLRFFRHHRERVEYRWEGGCPSVGVLYSSDLGALLGPPRQKDEPLTQFHRDVARSVQAMYEEAFFHLLRALHAKYRVDRLALAGGCAMNSVANGKVYKNTPFKKLYIQAAAGDAGGAIGAAFAVQNMTIRAASSPHFVMSHAYWGPRYSDGEIGTLLASSRTQWAEQGCTSTHFDSSADLTSFVASQIAGGKVVGWFQGRMEWGPRALGNRSIVCDPRRGDMKDILNLKIKRRESFRPFAPSVLREAVADWFETDDDVPFMMQVYQIREERRASVPAVTHVDGSGRLQTVDAGSNPLYHELIEAFRGVTGVPMILNTSFNENEPVVCTPEEALSCFLRTKMDCLVLGNFVLSRSGGETLGVRAEINEVEAPPTA